MIVDVTGVILTPGNCGKRCMGNGEHEGVECCCDECDYMLCCMEDQNGEQCTLCMDSACPNSPNRTI